MRDNSIDAFQNARIFLFIQMSFTEKRATGKIRKGEEKIFTPETAKNLQATGKSSGKDVAVRTTRAQRRHGPRVYHEQRLHITPLPAA